MKDYLIILETMFCDFELDQQVRDKFFVPWMRQLQVLSSISIPHNADLKVIIYLSEDKNTEIERLNGWVETLEPTDRSRFVLHKYSHPEEGYGNEDAKHPDVKKSPNKHSPLRDNLFISASQEFATENYKRIIRLAIDDDDWPLPWQFHEIVRAADLAYEDDQIVGVGLDNMVVAYVDAGVADIVEFTHHMNGNKFYVSSGEIFERQKSVSPWSIPEHFNYENRGRLSKIGVILKSVAGNIPGHIYFRWGHNLSLQDKSTYYRRSIGRANFTVPNDFIGENEPPVRVVREISQDEKMRIRKELAPDEDYPSAQHRYFFKLPYAEDRDISVAVFKDKNGDNILVRQLKPGRQYDTRSFPELNLLSPQGYAFIQKRRSDGSREAITPRARLNWLNRLSRLTYDELFSDGATYTQGQFEELGMLLELASWIWDNSTERWALKLHQESENRKHNPTKYQGTLLERVFKSEIRLHGIIETVLGHLRYAALFDELMGAIERASGRNTVLGEVPQHESFPCTKWPSLEKFERTSEIKNGRHRIESSNPIDFEVDAYNGRPLVVVLHGRKAPEVVLPYISGRGITADLDVSWLGISDPSLYIDRNLSIGWHSGSAQQPFLQQELRRLVEGIAAATSAPRIIFVGGSAGGFASLLLSSLIHDSYAVVWNPQTDIEQYYKRFVDEYIQKCWSGNLDAMRRSTITSVVDSYRTDEPNNKVVFLQEETDTFHVEKHMLPFCEAVNGRGSVYLYLSHWGNGHAAPPKELVRDCIELCLTDDLAEKAGERGFKQI